MSSLTTSQGAPAFSSWVAKGLPQGRWGRGRRDLGPVEILGHQVLARSDAERKAVFEGTRKDIGRLRRLPTAPLAQRLFDIRGGLHHPIHLPFTVVDPDGPRLRMHGGPGECPDFPHPQPAAPHEQEHRAIAPRVNDLEEPEQVLFRHRSGKCLRDQDLVSAPMDGLLERLPLRL
jgi:hypothetical protein